MRILVYKGKHGDAYWMANTMERAAGAREALFKMLDQDGCYAYDVDDELLAKAREGNPQAIERILDIRSDYEYEAWAYEYAEVIT